VRQPLVVYPTGAGETRHLDRGPIERYSSARWFPDGVHILACGAEAGHAERCYVQDVQGSAPHPVSPENTSDGRVSPDGRQILVRRGGRSGLFGNPSTSAEIYPLAGGPPRILSDLTGDDTVIKWESDGRTLLVSHGLLPARIERFSLETGRRDLVRTLAPNNLVGVTGITQVTVADDPNVYTYGINHQSSRLFSVQGAR